MQIDQFITRMKALENITKRWSYSTNSQKIAISQALKRVSSKAVLSKNTLPVCRNSKSDGIAVRFADFKNGVPHTSSWKKGNQYAMANTGGDFDDRFDTIIEIEDVIFAADGTLSFPQSLDVIYGQNIDPVGAVLKQDELIIDKGCRITALHQGLLAMAGQIEVEVNRKPMVIFIPTGSELVPYYQQPMRGENVESNSLVFTSLVNEYGADVKCYPICKDIKKQLAAQFERAIEEADIVVVSGGSSKGSEDFNTGLLAGRCEWWHHGIRCIPGIPVGIGMSDGKPVINIPGPPFPAFAVMEWCIRPLIHHAVGLYQPDRIVVGAELQEDIYTPQEFDYIQRVHVHWENGQAIATPLTWDDRFVLSMGSCNGLLLVPIGVKGYDAKTIVKVEMLQV